MYTITKQSTCWEDSNNNKWQLSYSKEQVSFWGKSCIYCSNCSDCSGCSNCSGCSGCLACSGCTYCSDCSNCTYCSDCSGCSDCTYCSNCTYCTYCSNCSDCTYCKHCSNFKQNPARYISLPLGSQARQTVLYWNEKQHQIVCGCFKGNIKQFEQEVQQKYGTNPYGIAYMELIKQFRSLLPSSAIDTVEPIK